MGGGTFDLEPSTFDRAVGRSGDPRSEEATGPNGGDCDLDLDVVLVLDRSASVDRFLPSTPTETKVDVQVQVGAQEAKGRPGARLQFFHTL